MKNRMSWHAQKDLLNVRTGNESGKEEDRRNI